MEKSMTPIQNTLPMDRAAAYQALVAQRKEHRFADGLLNPSEIAGGKFDSDELGPWSRWQGALDAEVVIVGQDWGHLAYFANNGGIDSDGEKTCTNLQCLAQKAGWVLGPPSNPNRERLFFTNAVLGIRQNGKSGGTIPDSWIKDSLPFLKELLTIIKPVAIVSLGEVAHYACRLVLLQERQDPNLPMKARLKDIIELNPIRRPGLPTWFGFYHCGPLGLANRCMELQAQDWQALGAWRSSMRT